MAYTPFFAGEILTAEKLNTRLIELVMDWTPLTSLGTFQNNFAPNPGKIPNLRIERVMGTLEWILEGRINNAGPVNMTNTTAVMFTFNTDYRPLAELGASPYAAASSHYPVRFGWMTNGNLTGSVPTGAASPSTIWLDGCRFTNPK